MSPEGERAQTMRAQIRAWMEKHRLSLSDAQLAILEENIAFITPELYRQPRDPSLQQQRDELVARTEKLFFWDQLVPAFFRNGPDTPTFVSTPMTINAIPLTQRVDLHVPMAFDGIAHARVQCFVDDRLVREEDVFVRCERGLPKELPVVVRTDVFSGIAEGHGRIVVTSFTEGARMWATALIRDGGERPSVIEPVA